MDRGEGSGRGFPYSQFNSSQPAPEVGPYFLNEEVQRDVYTALGPSFDFHGQQIEPDLDFPIVHEGIVPAEEYEGDYPEGFVIARDGQSDYEDSELEGFSENDDEMSNLNQHDFSTVNFGRDPSSSPGSMLSIASDESDQEIRESIEHHLQEPQPGGPRERGPGRGQTGTGRARGRGRGGWRAVLQKKAEEEGWSDDELIRKPKRQKIKKVQGRQKGVKVGPRRAAEPSLEFKRLQSAATKAYIKQNYDLALRFAREAVRENPEIYAAHSLLSEILRHMGNQAESVTVLIAGAHTARDAKIWIDAAGRVLSLDEHDKARQKQALYCLSQAISLDPNDPEPRWEKVKVLILMGRKGSKTVQNECAIILKARPLHWDALDIMAEIALQNSELPDIKKAIKLYDTAFDKVMSEEDVDMDEEEFSFAQLNLYLDLVERTGDYMMGISKLRSLSRWLVDREREEFWDWEKTDAEWDIDDHRRSQSRLFVPGQYPRDSYGESLPVELRAKLGIFRMKLGPEYMDEAVHHFNLILDFGVDPGAMDPDLQALHVTIGDLLKEEGDRLKEEHNIGQAFILFEMATEFYERVNSIDEDPDAGLLTSLAHCYKSIGRFQEAEKCYRRNLDVIGFSMQARIQLFVFYSDIDELEKAAYVMEEIDKLRVTHDIRRRYQGPYRPARRPRFIHKGVSARPTKRRAIRRAAQGTSPPRIVMDHLWANLRSFQEGVDAEDQDAIMSWLEIAEALIQAFRCCTDFWPNRDRINRFGGFSRQSLELQGKTPSAEVLRRAGNITGVRGKQRKKVTLYWGSEGLWNFPDLHSNFHGVSFTDWAHLFCQYALLLGKAGEIEEAKRTFEDVEDAVVFHYDEGIQKIRNVALLTFYLYINDEQGILTTARWFIKSNPLNGELYKLMGCLARQFVGRRTWFSSGPTQKFLARMLKMQDFALLSDENREKYDFTNVERSRWKSLVENTRINENRPGIEALGRVKEVDPSLLTLYAHTLSESRHISGLHYYFRAFCIRPNDPVINLSIASNFFQSAIKRRSDNRHYQILQGMAFMQRYYRIRTGPGSSAIHRQEAEYNVGRAFHQLGMYSTAIQAYQKCLELDGEVRKEITDDNKEEFTGEAAFALSQILGLSGNMELAREITERYLVL